MKALVVGSNATFRRVATLCESLVFMIAKGSNEIIDKAFTSSITWNSEVQQHAMVAEAPKTPRKANSKLSMFVKF